MYFTFSIHTTVLFHWWTTDSLYSYFMTCLFIICLAISYEWLYSYRLRILSGNPKKDEEEVIQRYNKLSLTSEDGWDPRGKRFPEALHHTALCVAAWGLLHHDARSNVLQCWALCLPNVGLWDWFPPLWRQSKG